MRNRALTSSAAILLGLLSSLAFAQTIDGTKDSIYGSALSVQTIQTGFGDNFSEWNAAYGRLTTTDLSLMFTGNLEGNFNKLEIFIDSSNAVTSNVFNSAGNDNAGNMDGMTFDTAFTPDYHLIIRRGNANNTDLFDIDFADLGAGAFTQYLDAGAGSNDMVSGSTGTGVNTAAILFGFDNSNMAGIGGSAGDAADQAAAQAVTTGLELQLSLADLGNPVGPIRVMLLQNNQGHDFLSNQTLGGLPVGTGNLGGTPSGIDFSSFDGDQFFTIAPVPEPSTAGLLGMFALAGLAGRRRRK
jgi:hypothetical protein